MCVCMGGDKKTCSDYYEQNIQQVHYKFDFRTRMWRILNLRLTTGEEKMFQCQGHGGSCCCRRFFTHDYDEIKP